MKVLFLDDCPARQQWAADMFAIDHESTQPTTAASAIESLRTLGPFDAVYLDHDLGDEKYVDSARSDCGFEVVRWIIENRPAIGEIIVHTINVTAGNLMTTALKRSGYPARHHPFDRIIIGLPAREGRQGQRTDSATRC